MKLTMWIRFWPLGYYSQGGSRAQWSQSSSFLRKCRQFPKQFLSSLPTLLIKIHSSSLFLSKKKRYFSSIKWTLMPAHWLGLLLPRDEYWTSLPYLQTLYLYWVLFSAPSHSFKNYNTFYTYLSIKLWRYLSTSHHY